MSKRRQALIDRAEALIAGVLAHPFPTAIDTWTALDEARVLSLQAGSFLLKAESMLQLCRSRSGSLDPANTLAYMQRAEQIFRANGLSNKAAVCQVGAAMSLFELGQERSAIAAADVALKETLLPIDYRAAAYIVKALCHGHIGELDEALVCANDHALPLAKSCGQQELLAKAIRTRGLIYLHVMIFHRWPGIWRGLPATVVTVDEPSPDPAFVIALLDEAHAALPHGMRWGYIDMGKHLAIGLSGGSHKRAVSIAALSGLAENTALSDPQMSAWSLFCKSCLLMLRPEDAIEALRIHHEIIEIAEPRRYLMVMRDVRLLQSRAYESIGDHANSLDCFKKYAELRFASLQGLIPAAHPAATGRDPKTRNEGLDQRHRLLDLEPAHVRSAQRFIEQRISHPITVADVVSHCGVSRRKLEVSFKQSKLLTIAAYIQRRKLELAATSLLITNRSIKEIGITIANLSPAAFSRVFNAYFGVSPSQWRNSGVTGRSAP